MQLGQFEIRGAEIDKPIKEAWSLEFASLYLKAVNMTDEVWIKMLRSDSPYAFGTLLKCQIGELGNVIFDLYPWKVDT